MGKKFPNIEDRQIEFMKAQQMFFVATATDDSRINLSPKGLDSLRILGENRVIWLNLTGSGNETAAHLLRVRLDKRVFCSAGQRLRSLSLAAMSVDPSLL